MDNDCTAHALAASGVNVVGYHHIPGLACGSPGGKYWTDTISVNFGCSWVSPACDNCWSATMHTQRENHPNAKMRAKYAGLTVVETTRFTGEIRLNDDALSIPGQVKAPQIFQVWNDLFHEAVPNSFIIEFLRQVSIFKHHRVLILTKRVERMVRFLNEYIFDPSNCYFGTTIENQQTYEERSRFLKLLPGYIRVFISFEPLIEAVTVAPDFWAHIHWAVIGGEAVPHNRLARPMNPMWAWKLIYETRQYGIPVWFKQWGSHRFVNGKPVPTNKRQAGRIITTTDGAYLYNEMPPHLVQNIMAVLPDAAGTPPLKQDGIQQWLL